MPNEKNEVIQSIREFINSPLMGIAEECYSLIRDTKGNRIHQNSIAVIEDTKFDALFPLVSIVILTANKIECDSLNYMISNLANSSLQKRKHAIPIFCGVTLRAPTAYLLKVDSHYFLHLNAYETGSNTPGGSSDLVRYVSQNSFLKPNAIISFGICYGRDPNNQHFGDVIIPRKLYPWSVGQKFSEKRFSIKHDNFNLSMEDAFSDTDVYTTVKDFCNGEDGRVFGADSLVYAPTRDFSVRVQSGNMSTGEGVISSDKVKRYIAKATKIENELGGEMEGYGLAKECIFFAKIPCLIVKAICDWGELKNINKALISNAPPRLKDKLQAYAAFCAGAILIQLLNQEKDLFLSLDLLKWFHQSRKHCVDKTNYESSDNIIALIKSFYGKICLEDAEKIFDLLVQHQIIVRSTIGTEFRVNPAV